MNMYAGENGGKVNFSVQPHLVNCLMFLRQVSPIAILDSNAGLTILIKIHGQHENKLSVTH